MEPGYTRIAAGKGGGPDMHSDPSNVRRTVLRREYKSAAADQCFIPE